MLFAQAESSVGPPEYMLGLVIVLAILFLVSIIFSWRTWKIHTILVMFVLLAAVGAFFGMAIQTLKTHQSWRQIIEGDKAAKDIHERQGLKDRTLKLAQQNEILKNGREVRGQITEDGIEQIEQKLVNMLLDRGRMYTQCRAAAPQQSGQVVVQIPKPNPSRLQQDVTVYAFESKNLLDGGKYLGEFKVVDIQGGGGEPAADVEEGGVEEEIEEEEGPVQSIATLAPTWEMTPEELDRLKQASTTWVLYDKMPVDGHFVFAEENTRNIPFQEVGLENPRQLEDLQRPDLLAKYFNEQVIAEYIRDGQDATEDDPVERIAVYVEFEQDHTPPKPKDPLDDEDRSFEKGQQAWILKRSVQDPESGDTIPGADDLAAEGVVKLVEGVKPRYVRELREYGFLFRQVYLNRQRQDFEIARVTDRINVVNGTLKEKQDIVAVFKATEGRLQFDLSKHQYEEKVLQEHYLALKKQFGELWRELVNTARNNQKVAAQIDYLQRKAAQQINLGSAPADQASAAP